MNNLIQKVEPEQSCANCRHWETEGGVSQNASFGWCHRYPPQLVAKNDGIDAVRPYLHNSDWCGEFEQNRGLN